MTVYVVWQTLLDYKTERAMPDSFSQSVTDYLSELEREKPALTITGSFGSKQTNRNTRYNPFARDALASALSLGGAPARGVGRAPSITKTLPNQSQVQQRSGGATSAASANSAIVRSLKAGV